MSFSTDVKEELMKHYSRQPHCRRAEAEALRTFDNQKKNADFENGVYIYSFTALKKTFNIKADFDISRDCCKRAYLRGAFIAAGTISNPEKTYRLDIVTDSSENAQFLSGLMNEFALNSKITRRRGRYVVYLKEAAPISDMLALMEANVAMMNFENARIIREMRGSVNRQVNCETANINKTINASVKQLEDIRLISEIKGLDNIDKNLKALAKARLNNPDATLSELGNILIPPVGKSGVNHRMRKLSLLADNLRKDIAAGEDL